MKKLIVVAFASVVGLGLTSPAQAANLPVDGYPEIPDFCILDIDTVGPSRAAHSPATEVDEETPLCSELNICFTSGSPTGPSRMPHGSEITYGDCTDVTDECVLPLPDAGPSRGIHPAVPSPSPTPEVTPEPTPEVTPEPTIVIVGPSIYIEQPCQEQLSLALAPVPGGPVVGSNSTPTILMASALVLTGGLLLLGQRRLARR